MKVLITGANGQLGSAIINEVINFTGFELIKTDFNDLDITNSLLVANALQNLKPDFVVNCAAYTTVDKAEEEADKALLINAEAVDILAKQCRNLGIGLIHISTDYVFDGTGNTPYTESDKVNPLSVYGKSKLKGEELALSAGNTMIIRTSWLYSAYGSNFMKTIIKHAKTKPELRVVFDQTGTPTLANDLAITILTILSSPKKYFKPEVFHFSNHGVCSWYDFAYEIVNLSGLTTRVTPITTAEYPTRAIRPQYSVLSKQKICNLLNIDIPYWRNSLAQCIKNIKD